MSKPLKIHVIAVAFEKHDALKIFVQSWINQTQDDWLLTVIHDGPNELFNIMMLSYQQEYPNKIDYLCTDRRFNDYGHSLREIGLLDIKGEYVLLTNADNYFIPKAVELISKALVDQNPDIIMFDMVHSHDRPGGRNLPPYSNFETKLERLSIDISCAIVKANLAKKAGFRDKSHDGDASYFEDVIRAKFPEQITLVKIPQILFVHN